MTAFRLPPPASCLNKANQGFALLLTVTLLAFLVVLLVGLAAYTRVETAVAGNTQRQAQARQNALLALNVALGQLQKYAGPDQRVTATADAFPNANSTKHFTGVWDTTLSARTTPLTWLVSGNELSVGGVSAPRAVTPRSSFTTTNSVELVGKNSSGTASDVVVRLMPITTVGLPGATAATTAIIGRYAWWVGDQGVKAPVALADPTNTDPTSASSAYHYSPYSDFPDLLTRIRQQISLGAGAADTTGAAVFEPRDTAGSPSNAAFASHVTATNQLAFFNKTGGTVGLPTLQQNFHTWSPNNFAVLANTKLGGLRQDLSLYWPLSLVRPANPSPLGTAFDLWANPVGGAPDAWAKYNPTETVYMDDPANPAPPTPSPSFSNDPLRRRYKISPAIFSPSVGVSPVLTYFYVLFGVRKPNASSPYTLSLRWAAALWNPYTSALVPEDLRLEISGLPTSITTTVVDPSTGATTDDVTVNLRQLYGDPLKVTLPWTISTNPAPDEVSWLPGRIYNWTYAQNTVLQVGGDNPGTFNSRSLGAFADGLTVTVPGSNTVNGSSQLALKVGSSTTLTVKLRRANGDLLATYTSQAYDAVPITQAGDASNNTSQLGFLFRLAESVDTAATPEIWLAAAGRDPRSDQLPPESLLALPNGTNPANYRNFVTVRAPGRLLDRDITSGTSYNEDVPLLELPRAPLLSIGELQHFYLAGARPFSIGNSWGGGVQLNGIDVGTLFDRFFFSGLAPGVTPTVSNGSLMLPNPLLKPLPRNSGTGSPVTLANLQNAPNAQSSKFLLQGGAFNLNSVSPTAWAAVLRSVRFPEAPGFTYLDADPTTGTGPDSPPATPPIQSSDAQFFRFAQSAQETYKADDGYVQSTSGSEQDVIDTPLFRRGMRTLSTTQVSALTTAITDLIKAHQAASGPFRTLEDFLSPAAAGNPSLLEQAISDAGINASVTEFSSQWLTQGDIMTALAPVLFPRSDTFVIRTYGEAVNPTTNATEGRAWCEAIAQRVPDYVDSSAATGDAAEVAPASLNDTNKNFGRRIKIISFRWLTCSDI